MDELLNLMRKGMSPEQIFRMMCKQRGVDPDAFLRSVREMIEQKGDANGRNINANIQPKRWL